MRSAGAGCASRSTTSSASEIRFEPAGEDRDRIKAVVVLREGEPVTLLLRSSTTFYGQTPSGAYQIRARDLKSIDFAR